MQKYSEADKSPLYIINHCGAFIGLDIHEQEKVTHYLKSILIKDILRFHDKVYLCRSRKIL